MREKERERERERESGNKLHAPDNMESNKDVILWYLPSFQSVVRLVMFHDGNRAFSQSSITTLVDTWVPNVE